MEREPQLRDVYCVRTAKGKFGLVWVVGGARPWEGEPQVRVAYGLATAKQPTLASARKVEPLEHTWESPVAIGVANLGTQERIPSWVTYLGQLARLPTIKPQAAYIQWDRIRQLMDFRNKWDDFAPIRAANQAKEAAKQARAAKKPRTPKRKPTETLAAIGRRRLLRDWTDLVEEGTANKGRKLIKDLVTKLLKLGDAKPERKLKLFSTCVSKLNALDEANDGFIATAEREVLLDELQAIAVAASLGDLHEELDDWRDW